MVEVRAEIFFNEPVNSPQTEYQKEHKCLFVNLDHFAVGQWTAFKREYDFKPEDSRALLMWLECEISGEAFLGRFGRTVEEASRKLAERGIDEDLENIFDVENFYVELQERGNTIKSVVLQIVELW